MEQKDLEYYLNLEYQITISKMQENEGGGYSACIEQLGKYAFIGDGETVKEALEDLKEVKEILFAEYLEKGIPIPEPDH